MTDALFDVDWTRTSAQGPHVSVSGDFSAAAVPALRQVVDMLRDGRSSVVEFDLSRVTSASPRGIAALVLAKRRLRAHGIQVMVTGVSDAFSVALQRPLGLTAMPFESTDVQTSSV